MSTLELHDQTLSCATCGDGFIFSAGEQELFRIRGKTEAPRQCPRCQSGRTRLAAQESTIKG